MNSFTNLFKICSSSPHSLARSYIARGLIVLLVVLAGFGHDKCAENILYMKDYLLCFCKKRRENFD